MKFLVNLNPVFGYLYHVYTSCSICNFFVFLLVGIKDLYIHIQNVDLLTTPADEVYPLTDPVAPSYLDRKL